MATKTRKQWDKQNLERAIEELKKGELPLRTISAKYNIPRSTLSDYLKGRSKVGMQPGPATVLTTEEENMLTEWALKMFSIGYGQTRRQVCEVVKRILDTTQRPNPFTDNRPGRYWWHAFLNRHPQLTMRQPQALQAVRASACTPQVLDQWFSRYEQFLMTHNLLNKPHCIWNCDESGFPLCPKTGKVLALKGADTVYNVTGSNKRQITTLCCISAAGGVVPPMHIYPGERFGYNPLEGGVDGAYFGKSPNGWMCQDLFNGWISKHFSVQIAPARPVMLLVDGHNSHIDLDTSKFCEANGIILYCLPPHASHVLQPLDVGFFSPLKRAWQQCVTQYQQENGIPVDKRSFARVFRSAYTSVVKLSTIVNAFRASGLHPVNRKAISSAKLLPSELYKDATSGPVSSKTTVSISSERSGYRLALSILEREMGTDMVSLFMKRFEEGYDLSNDPLYTTWVKLKRGDTSVPISPAPSVVTTDQESVVTTTAAHTQATAVTVGNTVFNQASTASDPVTTVSVSVPISCSVPDSNSQLKEILQVPIPRPTKKPKKGVSHMPNHLSGEEMIRILEDRRMKKLEEEKKKAARKAEREEKRKKKEEERQRRAARKQQREVEKQQKAAEKKQKVAEKQQKVAAKKQKAPTQPGKESVSDTQKMKAPSKEQELQASTTTAVATGKKRKMTSSGTKLTMKRKRSAQVETLPTQQEDQSKKRKVPEPATLCHKGKKRKVELLIKQSSQCHQGCSGTGAVRKRRRETPEDQAKDTVVSHKRRACTVTESAKTATSEEPDLTLCPVCESAYEEEKEEKTWIECSVCHRWYHLNCTKIPRRQYSRLEHFQFICQYCQ